MNRRSVCPRSVTLVALLLACSCGKKEKLTEEIVRPVRYQPVFETGGTRVRSFSGISRAGMQSKLSFKVGGTIEELPVKIGDQVKAGQLIARIDAKDFRLQVEEADAALRAAQAEQRRAAADYDRTRGLYEAGHTSLTELDGARARSESAEANVRAAEKKLELARSKSGYTRLTAPVDGSIAAVNTEMMENVQPGQAIVSMTAGSEHEVEVSVPEVLIANIKEGSAVKVSFDALPGKIFGAVVTEVGVSSMGAGTTFPVTVLLDESHPDIRPGMAAEVAFSFETGAGRNRILVPPVAVGEDRQGRFVFVVEDVNAERGVARRRDVEVGELTSEGIEIRSGLAEGDLLVTAGVTKLVDGTTVKLLARSES